MRNERETKNPFPDKKNAIDLEESYRELIKLQQQIEQEKVIQAKAEWKVPMDMPEYPIAIHYMTDVHYGARDMDLGLIEKNLKLISETPNMYIILGGDMIHNMTSKGIPKEDLIPPDAQARLIFRSIIEIDKQKKLGAVVLGDHDGWSPELIEPHINELSAPIFPPSGGVLEINLGQTSYEVGVIHKHSGRNKYNITNAGKEALKEVFSSRDGVLIGHDHRMAGEIYHSEENRKHFVIQGGTYRKDNILSSETATGMTVMLWPNKKLFAIQTIEAASFWLNEAAKNNL